MRLVGLTRTLLLVSLILGLSAASASAAGPDKKKLRAGSNTATLDSDGSQVSFSAGTGGDTVTFAGFTMSWDAGSCSYKLVVGGTLHEASFTGTMSGNFSKTETDTSTGMQTGSATGTFQ